MKWIIIDSKKVVISIITTLIFISFLTGFFIGDRDIVSLPVLSQRLVPIYKVDRDDNKIAITLDGTWGANYTEELLEIFDEYNLKITFFFAGYWLEKYPELVKKIADTLREQNTATDEIKDTVEQLNQITQQNSSLVEEISSSSENMSSEASNLEKLVDQFNLSLDDCDR